MNPGNHFVELKIVKMLDVWFKRNKNRGIFFVAVNNSRLTCSHVVFPISDKFFVPIFTL